MHALSFLSDVISPPPLHQQLFASNWKSFPEQKKMASMFPESLPPSPSVTPTSTPYVFWHVLGILLGYIVFISICAKIMKKSFKHFLIEAIFFSILALKFLWLSSNSSLMSRSRRCWLFYVFWVHLLHFLHLYAHIMLEAYNRGSKIIGSRKYNPFFLSK